LFDCEDGDSCKLTTLCPLFADNDTNPRVGGEARSISLHGLSRPHYSCKSLLTECLLCSLGRVVFHKSPGAGRNIC
jgi:hypothetical protein